MRLFSIIMVTLGLHSFSIGQDSLAHKGSKANCDSIVKYPDKEPQIANYESTLDMVNEVLFPIFHKHYGETHFISKYYFFYVVDNKGEIINVDIKKGIQLPDDIKNEIVKALIEKTGWTPGQINNQACCSHAVIAINIDL